MIGHITSSLLKVQQLLRNKESEYARLWELNLEPENQHNWDEMLRVEGYIAGLKMSEAILQSLLNQLVLKGE